MNRDDSNQATEDTNNMRSEYDFSHGIQGKHARAYQQGYTVTIRSQDGTEEVRHYEPQKAVVVLAPDVAKAFPNSTAVNEALRFLIRVVEQGSSAVNEGGQVAHETTSE